MRELGRFVRFCFGLQTISALGDLAMLFLPFVVLSWHKPSYESDARDVAFSMMLRAAYALAFDIVPAIAWLALRAGDQSARSWALTASCLNLIPISGLNHFRSVAVFSSALRLPFWAFGTVVGVAGLVAFSRKQVAEQTTDAPRVKPLRLKGDGTGKYKDRIAGAVGIILLVFSFHWWTRWSVAHELHEPGILFGLVQLQLAILISTLGHEFGHLIAGWVSDMRVRSLQVGPLVWVIRNGRWKFSFEASRFSGGAVGMVPIHLKNIRGREVFMILGGPVASLVMGTIGGVAALSAKGQAWEPLWAFLSMTAVVSTVGFIVNLIPQKPEAQYSDGAQIYQLVTNGPWAQVHLAFAMVASSLVTALRPRDFDVTLINRAGDFIAQGDRGMLLRLFACMHYIDAGQTSEAVASLEKAESLWDQAVVKRPAGICAEFVFFCAVYKRDAASAELWWQRLQAQRKIEFDADYWKARASIMWVRNQPAEAFHAWERGKALAADQPDAGAYEFTRSCFERLRTVLDTAAPQIEAAAGPLPLVAAQ